MEICDASRDQYVDLIEFLFSLTSVFIMLLEACCTNSEEFVKHKQVVNTASSEKNK